MLSNFEYLISVLCSDRVLWLPRDDDHFTLHTDASYKGVGGVLSALRDGVERPVGYFSKALTETEKRYSATEIECLAIYRSVDHFAIHFLGRTFAVVTDHKALEALFTSQKLNTRLFKWALSLQPYSFKVEYRPGSTHQNADGLSRQAWDEDFPSEHDNVREGLCPPQGGGGGGGGDVEGRSTWPTWPLAG